MILYNLIHQSGRRIIFFPLSQFSRVTVNKTKHDFGNKDFKKLVNKILKPLLELKDFQGKDYLYYRLRNHNIDTVLLGTSPYGKAICVNVEIKKFNGDFESINTNEIEKLESISPNQIGWKRLSPDEKDCWWRLKPTENENKKVVKEIYNLIKLEGEKYFKKFNKYYNNVPNHHTRNRCALKTM